MEMHITVEVLRPFQLGQGKIAKKGETHTLSRVLALAMISAQCAKRVEKTSPKGKK